MCIRDRNEAFHATKGTPGGLLEVRARFPMGRVFSAYTEVEAKTRGWVMANPYLKENITCRVGIALDLGRATQ